MAAISQKIGLTFFFQESGGLRIFRSLQPNREAGHEKELRVADESGSMAHDRSGYEVKPMRNAVAMTSFSLRIPATLVPHVNSAQMSTWIAEFLRRQHPLPPDPGPGEDRVCLSFPKKSLDALVQVIGCSRSEALRRIALDAVSPVLDAQSELEASTGVWNPAQPLAWLWREREQRAQTVLNRRLVVGLIVLGVGWALCVAGFLVFTRGKATR